MNKLCLFLFSSNLAWFLHAKLSSGRELRNGIIQLPRPPSIDQSCVLVCKREYQMLVNECEAGNVQFCALFASFVAPSSFISAV